MNKKNLQWVNLTNRIFLGLLMFVPGILKLFINGHSGVTGMLSGIGFPIVGFFAWILIFSEIVFGVAIMVNWRLRYTVIPPIIILLIATFTVHLGNYSSMLLHLVAVTNYLLIAYKK